MKIEIIILLLLFNVSNNFCMKRPFNSLKQIRKTSKKQPHAKKQSKEQPIINQSKSLHKFFININKELISQKYYSSMELKAIKRISKLPRDIKRIIITKTFNIPQEWWYCEKKWEYQDMIYAVSFNPKNDNHLAIGFFNGLKIINPETNKNIKSNIHLKEEIFALTYNNDGSSLACGLDDELKIISTKNNEYLSTYPLKGTHWSLSFNSDNSQLTVGTEIEAPINRNVKAIIKVIDINNKKEIFSQDIYEKIYGVYMHSNNELTYALIDQNVSTINIDTKNIKNIKKTLEISEEYLFALAYNKNNNTFALGFKHNNNNTDNDKIKKTSEFNDHNKVLIIDPLTKQIISSFNNTSPVYTLSFTENGQKLAIGLTHDKTSTLLLLKKHNQPTERQHLLHRILYLWLQVEKPDKSINNAQKLLDTISTKFYVNKKELATIWSRFPEALQLDLWNNMNRLIQKYGKKID